MLIDNVFIPFFIYMFFGLGSLLLNPIKSPYLTISQALQKKHSF